MNKLLLNNKPIDSSNEEFTKAWNNSSYVLEALYKTLCNINTEISSIKKDDFDCPNHYAKLSYQMGQAKMIEFVIDLLPDSAKG
jgi:enoyl-[acyl-carrier-protein] reductase (NADH)